MEAGRILVRSLVTKSTNIPIYSVTGSVTVMDMINEKARGSQKSGSLLKRQSIFLALSDRSILRLHKSIEAERFL